MEFLNQNIAALAKKKKRTNLVRRQISCGIFQELPKEEETKPRSEHLD